MIKNIFLSFTFNIFLFAANDLAVLKIADVPAKALYITQAPKDNTRLFVVIQTGKIFIIKNNQTVNAPFLDISDRVHSSLLPGS